MKDFKNILTRFKVLFPQEESNSPFTWFGFECGIGWYNIINNAFEAICADYFQAEYRLKYFQKYLDDLDEYYAFERKYSKKDQDLSDEALLKNLNEKIDESKSELELRKQELPEVAQIKEKFGTLRLYLDSVSLKFDCVVHYAGMMSAVTCEDCGNAGETYRMGWHRTLCREHAVQQYGEDAVSKYEDDRKAIKEITELGEKQGE